MPLKRAWFSALADPGLHDEERAWQLNRVMTRRLTFKQADDQDEQRLPGKWIQVQPTVRVAVLWHLDRHDGAVCAGPHHRHDPG